MEEEKNKTPEETKTGSTGVIILNIILALITVGLVGYIAYKNGYIKLDNIFNTKESQEENSTEEKTEEEENTLAVFAGEYISAILPPEWKIQEYYDGEGSEMLVDGVTYTGLTGIKIFNGDKEIMMLEGVSGIGFVGCSHLPLFEDSSTAYKTEMEEMNEEVGMDLTTTDYTNAKYSDFEFLGKPFRRVNNELYYDTVLGNEYFEPQCEKGLATLKGLYFVDSYEYKGEAYHFEISDTASNAELELLDSVLASFTTD